MTNRIFFSFLFFLFIVCVVNSPVSALAIDIHTNIPADISPEKYLFVKELNAKGKVVFFYQDHEGYTHYYNGKKDKIINREIMDKYKKKGAVPMAMSYGYDGKHLYFTQPVRWGPKKLIVIKLEPNGKVLYTKELSSLEQAIKPASIAFDGKGNMLLTWLDETPPYLKGAYMLVKGDGFSEKEDVISFENGPVQAARPVYTDAGFAIIYAKTEKKGKGEIRARFLSDGAEKVLDTGRVFDFDLTAEEGLFLIRPYEVSKAVRLLVFNVSLDKVKEHTVRFPKETSGQFSLYSNPGLIGGEPFVLGTGTTPGSIMVEGYRLPHKANLYYSYAGRDFERVVGKTPFMFTSTSPSFDSSKGHVVLAYTDKRFISPNVMVAVCDRGGKLIKNDVLMEEPWVRTGSPRVVHLDGDVFRVFYPVVDKGKKVWICRAKDINASTINNVYHLPPLKEREKLLIDTAKKFADCRKKNNYGCVYSLFDSMYRSGTPKDQHTQMMKQINAKILDYRVEACKILDDSCLAACDSYMKAELPSMIRNINIKEQERHIERKIRGTIWVFIDKKWYYVVDLPMLGYTLRW
jgi:hypothetical protein